MVIETEGDIFATPYALRIQGVNCQSVIGGGISGAFLREYPGLKTFYQDICFSHALEHYKITGTVHVFGEPGHWTGLAFTQVYPGPNARHVFIRNALDKMPEICGRLGLTEFAMPAIGAGIGGIPYPDVIKIVHSAFDHWSGTCHIYKPWAPE